jgi:hypothetical protein
VKSNDRFEMTPGLEAWLPDPGDPFYGTGRAYTELWRNPKQSFFTRLRKTVRAVVRAVRDGMKGYL